MKRPRNKAPARTLAGAKVHSNPNVIASAKDESGLAMDGERNRMRLDRLPRGYKSGGFIQSAIKHPGAFSAAAKRAGKSTAEFAQEHKGDKGTMGRRARLAITLGKLRPK